MKKKICNINIYILIAILFISCSWYSFGCIDVKASTYEGEDEWVWSYVTDHQIQSDGSVLETSGYIGFKEGLDEWGDQIYPCCAVQDGDQLYFASQSTNAVSMNTNKIMCKEFKQVYDNGNNFLSIEYGNPRRSYFYMSPHVKGFSFPVFFEDTDKSKIYEYCLGNITLNDFDRNEFQYDSDNYIIDDKGQLKEKEYKYDGSIPTPQNLKVKGDLGSYTLYWTPVKGYEVQVMAKEKYSYKKSFAGQRLIDTVDWTNMTSEGIACFDSASGKAPVGDSALKVQIPNDRKYIKVVEIMYKARFTKEENGKMKVGDWAVINVNEEDGEYATGEQQYQDDETGTDGDDNIKYNDDDYYVNSTRNFDFVDFIKSIPDLGSEIINMASGCTEIPSALGMLIPIIPATIINLLKCAMIASIVLAIIKWIRG